MTQHYKGSCQCGAVTYEVDIGLGSPITCNCSRCERMGFVLAFATRDSFDLKSGEENLTEYRFNKGEIQHLFCSTCSVESFSYGNMPDGAVAAINVNCLEGVNPRELECKHYDGASM